ncbi:10241_t:CDS:1, partial [Entrophospora sp. SA101]
GSNNINSTFEYCLSVGSTSKNDLLYGMIEAAEKEGYEISSNDLRDELVTFFLAGHD